MWGASTNNGAAVKQYQCHDGANQKWNFVGNTLRPDHAPHMCLDVWGSAKTDGGRLAIYQCHGGQNQQFSRQ